MHLTAEAVAGVLEMSDAEAGPGRSVVLVLPEDGIEEFASTVEVFAATSASHEGGESGPGLEVFFREIFTERWGERGAMIGLLSHSSLEIADPLKGTEDFVADFGLDADEIEGRYVDGTSGTDALAGDVEELPVEIEALVGAKEVSRE